MLYLDAGNTYLKAAVYEASGWRRVAHVRIAAVVAGEALPSLADEAALGKTWWASVVAGAAVKARLSEWAAAHQAELRFVRAEAAAYQLINAYLPPESLGVDRYCALLGARRWQLTTKAYQAVLVANLGTAMTIDYLSADGVFQGGSIAPGLAVQRQALARHTAQLPQAGESLAAPTTEALANFADHTLAAITAGTWQTLIGALIYAWQSACQRSPTTPTALMLSGGDAESMAAMLHHGKVLSPAPASFMVAPYLVLDGLRHRAAAEIVSPAA